MFNFLLIAISIINEINFRTHYCISSKMQIIRRTFQCMHVLIIVDWYSYSSTPCDVNFFNDVHCHNYSVFLNNLLKPFIFFYFNTILHAIVYMPH